MNLHIVSGNPPSDQGQNGEYALDPVTNVIYKKTAGTWSPNKSLSSPAADDSATAAAASASDAADSATAAADTLAAAELLANKSTNLTTDVASDTKYPSCKAVADYVDSIVNP